MSKKMNNEWDEEWWNIVRLIIDECEKAYDRMMIDDVIDVGEKDHLWTREV